MTSRTGTPTALTAYLRRATWGLPKARQQELWDELEEHVLTRADHLCALGAPPQEALAQALRELGPPTRVTAGMTQVYLMPKLLLSAGVAALALSAALYALAGGGGERTVVLPALSSRPPTVPICIVESAAKGALPKTSSAEDTTACAVQDDPALYKGAFISLSDLKKALEASGMTADVLSSGSLNVRYPSGTRLTIDPEFQQGGQGYVQAAAPIAIAIREAVTPQLQLRGYDNPLLTLGSERLQLGSAAAPVNGVDFYPALLPTLVNVVLGTMDKGQPINVGGINRRSLLNGPYGASSLTITSYVPVSHKIQTGLKLGEVAMLVTERGSGWAQYLADAAPVGPDGTATFYGQPSNLRFVTSPAQLSPYPGGGRIPALLVRITNVPLRNLKTGIFLPSQPTSDAN
ncbi:hypothetical protein DAERI_030385 [Deinococcus aerius]|uniref:Uncharacterized protein n=1 Tax=Deinococcus aerius TaxID=200253 RepID=A0A2I9CTU1_9DEIO|nr:permease prefix domain 1-containing protein [Deinococcus aerius]GBF05219.1 hypothetical protein DAERI_030385 [Deinococcus aerius]